MRFRIGDRELELELLTFRLKRLQKPKQQPLQPREETKSGEENVEEILELSL